VPVHFAYLAFALGRFFPRVVRPAPQLNVQLAGTLAFTALDITLILFRPLPRNYRPTSGAMLRGSTANVALLKTLPAMLAYHIVPQVVEFDGKKGAG
jgi:hypothetical protein